MSVEPANMQPGKNVQIHKLLDPKLINVAFRVINTLQQLIMYIHNKLRTN